MINGTIGQPEPCPFIYHPNIRETWQNEGKSFDVGSLEHFGVVVDLQPFLRIRNGAKFLRRESNNQFVSRKKCPIEENRAQPSLRFIRTIVVV